jgi:ABC-type antimicrobial peptide transport system permease subunit
MRFTRLFIVVALITLAGGAFGAAVGALLGYAAPTALEAMFDTVMDEHDGGRVGVKLEVSGENQPGKTAHGAALGSAWGLVTGAAIAIVIGVIDQIILAVLTGLGTRKEPPQTRAVA